MGQARLVISLVPAALGGLLFLNGYSIYQRLEPFVGSAPQAAEVNSEFLIWAVSGAWLMLLAIYIKK